MSKFSSTVKAMRSNLSQNWNKPKEGEFLSYKQFFSFCVGASGILIFSQVQTLIGFGAGFFCGSIMGINVRDFVTINLIWMVLCYLLIFLQPIWILVFENHGHIDKKSRNIALITSAVRYIVAIVFYLLPITYFDFIVKGFFKIIANMLVVSTTFDLLNWAIRYKFSRKYGRVKPFIVLYAIPAVVFYSFIPWLPYHTMDYTTKLTILHLVFSIAGSVGGAFANPYAMVNFMTQNTHERQRLWSIGPVITGLFRSILGIILPIVIARGGFMGIPFGGYEDLWSYKIMIPSLAILSLIFAFPFLNVKENLIEQRIDRPKVKFFAGAKNVFRNKYFWIQNTSGFLGSFGFMVNSLMNFWIIYILRSTWALGIIGAIVAISSVVPNLITPLLIKKFEKRTLYLVCRISVVCITALQLLVFLSNLFIIYIILMFINTIFDTVERGIGNGLNGDIQDYHQWKFGERADATSGIFGWFLNPVYAVIGFLAPWVYRQYGYTSDWGIFYDMTVFKNLFIVSYIATFSAGVMSVIPFFFYDLTTKKHRQYVDEIRERVKRADIDALLIKIREGHILDIDADTMQKLKEEGVDVESLQKTVTCQLTEEQL